MGRVRIRKNKVSHLGSTDKAELTKKVNTIVKAQIAAKEATILAKRKTEELQELMDSLGVTQHTTDKGVAEYYTPAGKATRTVDVTALKSMVTQEDFLNTVTAPIGKVKKILTDAELGKITTVREPAKKEPVLRVLPLENA